jgi:hypothetical protein
MPRQTDRARVAVGSSDGHNRGFADFLKHPSAARRRRAFARGRRKQYAEDKDYREAILARNRAFRVAHRDEINTRAREAYARDDGYRARKRRSGNKWYSPEKRLAQVYGLSPQDYDAMLAEQGGVCAICKTRPDKPLFVDHSHATGKVRGLLCRPCNFSLGFMRDDPRVTAAATEYLLKAAARDDKPK